MKPAKFADFGNRLTVELGDLRGVRLRGCAEENPTAPELSRPAMVI